MRPLVFGYKDKTQPRRAEREMWCLVCRKKIGIGGQYFASQRGPGEVHAHCRFKRSAEPKACGPKFGGGMTREVEVKSK